MELNVDNPMSLLVLAGAVTPFITAILTKLRDPDWFKGLVSMTLAVIVGVIGSLQLEGDIMLDETLRNAFGVWLVHLMTYFGISKDAVARLSKATVGFAPVSLKRGGLTPKTDDPTLQLLVDPEEASYSV